MLRNKVIVATFFLALYAFIATPISFWHFHKADGNKADKEQQSSVAKKSTTVNEAKCKICDHHYSVGLNDAITVYFSPIKFYNHFFDFYRANKIASPSYGKSNKGPPAVA
jgi:hypothetical protein